MLRKLHSTRTVTYRCPRSDAGPVAHMFTSLCLFSPCVRARATRGLVVVRTVKSRATARCRHRGGGAPLASSTRPPLSVFRREALLAPRAPLFLRRIHVLRGPRRRRPCKGGYTSRVMKRIFHHARRPCKGGYTSRVMKRIFHHARRPLPRGCR